MPVPTVSSLCRLLGSDLAPAAGFTATDAPVTAVHISELADPVAYLSGGELLLTTGMTLPSSRSGCESYVARLKSAAISALAIGIGPVHDEPPVALVAACRRLGLVLLVVPAPTPFLTITKAYWAAVSSTAERQLKDVLATQRRLVESAASSDPVAGVLRTLARSLDGWAASFAPDGGLDHVHPAGAIEDALGLRDDLTRLTGVHSAASFSAATAAVVVYPLAVGDSVAGYLAVGSTAPLDPEQRKQVLTAAALLSLDATRKEGGQSAADTAQRCVGLLVDQGFAEPARRLAMEVGAPVPGQRVRVLVVHGRDSDASTAAVHRWSPDVLAVATDRETTWYLVPAAHPPIERLDATLASEQSLTAALSDVVPVTQVSAVRSMLMTLVGSLPPGTRYVVGGDGPYDRRLVGQLDERLEELSDPELAGLVAYLRHRGHWDRAARALGVHRNTLRHRIGRCRQQIEADLDDPDVAAELWLLLRRRGSA